LHVLGLPPAFVLSQDQTLKLIQRFSAIPDEPETTDPAQQARTSVPAPSNAQAFKETPNNDSAHAEPPSASPFSHHNVKEQKGRENRRHRGASEGGPFGRGEGGL
ncbi:MAG: hypothetical protein ACE5ED_04690, partial [Rhodothalassiaceae bacterium]